MGHSVSQETRNKIAATLRGYKHTPEALAKMALRTNRRGGRKFGYLKPGLEPTVKPSLLDIAWAAGVYEGEGTVNARNISIAQKDKWILIRLRSLFGGSVYDYGNVCSAWQVSGARARGFALTIFSFLSPRRRLQLRSHKLLGELQSYAVQGLSEKERKAESVT